LPEAVAVTESPECFEEQTVLDFLAGRLARVELDQVERHLGACALCTDLVAVSAPLLNGTRVNATLQQSGGSDGQPTVAINDDEESPHRRKQAMQPGTVLRDTYQIVRRIGQGGMGDVYEAKHARLTGRYAVKVLPPEFALNEGVLSRFRREAQIASGLQHPNIVQVIDFHETDDGTPYLVMEYLDGEDLAAWMVKQGPVSLHEAMPLVEQIGAALGAVHRRGITHRDVKPQNVFLIPQEGGRTLIKLVDFGLSKAHAPSMVVTRQPMLLGTPQYMAPEQALARVDEVGPASDQFALAAIIYQLLSGRPPFVGERVSSVLYQIVHEDPPPLGPGVDPRVETVLRRGLAKQVKDRFASMADFMDALQKTLLPAPPVLASVPAPPPESRPGDSVTRSLVAEPPRPRRARLLVAIGATAFLVTLGALFVIRPGHPRPPAAEPPAVAGAGVPSVAAPRSPEIPAPPPAAVTTAARNAEALPPPPAEVPPPGAHVRNKFHKRGPGTAAPLGGAVAAPAPDRESPPGAAQVTPPPPTVTPAKTTAPRLVEDI
jgi:serine/threonine-protein kinase